jgi:hypothetical protein
MPTSRLLRDAAVRQAKRELLADQKALSAASNGPVRWYRGGVRSSVAWLAAALSLVVGAVTSGIVNYKIGAEADRARAEREASQHELELRTRVYDPLYQAILAARAGLRFQGLSISTYSAGPISDTSFAECMRSNMDSEAGPIAAAAGRTIVCGYGLSSTARRLLLAAAQNVLIYGSPDVTGVAREVIETDAQYSVDEHTYVRRSSKGTISLGRFTKSPYGLDGIDNWQIRMQSAMCKELNYLPGQCP